MKKLVFGGVRPALDNPVYDEVSKTAEVVFPATEVSIEIDEPLGPVKHYVTLVGYRLRDPSQNAVITHEPSPAHENEWVRAQLAAGLIKEVPTPAGG